MAVLAVWLVAFGAAAQTDAQFSQYFEVPNYYNAAAIGTTDLLKIRGGARLQWLGIKHAPQTFLVAADMPFKFIGKRWGVGLVMQQESYGLYKNLNLGAQIAYRQKLFKGNLSIGAQIGFVDQSFKGTDVFIPRTTITRVLTTPSPSRTYAAMRSTSRPACSTRTSGSGPESRARTSHSPR